jgi:hypothetical protein
MLVETMVLSLSVLLFFSGVIAYRIVQMRGAEKLPELRIIPGLSAIEEAIGRATEIGRPIHFSPGIGGMSERDPDQIMASMQFLQHVSKLAGQYRTPLITTICHPEVFPVAEEVARHGFTQAGAPELYTSDTVRFISSANMAYAAGVLGIFQREKPAANFMIGAWYAETMMIAEAAAQAGAIQIGGTARMAQLPYLVVVCDYTLLGEEVYAGGAYLSGDRLQLGSLAGQDMCKLLCVAAVAIGVILESMNIKIFTMLLDKFGK